MMDCALGLQVDAQTEGNHDTALTLACAGGHAELVSLLLSRGADIEHRDKKGFTPLILASTGGHTGVAEILLDHGADIEAQSERTKDSPLSLACSGGRYEVRYIYELYGQTVDYSGDEFIFTIQLYNKQPILITVMKNLTFQLNDLIFFKLVSANDAYLVVYLLTEHFESEGVDV